MESKSEEGEIKEDSKPMVSSSRVARALWIAAGTIFLGFGIVGIILPLLPTTPLLLLAAACYIRGSERMYKWLLSNKWFGEYIRNYQEKKGIPLKIKIWAISFLWITITLTMFFFIDIVWVRIILIVIAVLVTYHILSLRTI